jgi:UDP-N-acetylglucosamine 3-dehydrogenase
VKKPLKVGIIGCGGIAPLHIKVYKNLKDVEIAGLCDLNFERAKSLAARYKIPRTFADYWKMLETEELGLVDICTPVSTHAKIVCDVSKEVPAILVEKPMALTVGECEQMINELKKNGSKLCIGHNQIFSPNILKAKSLVDSGKFDLLSFITTQKESFELLKAHNLAPAWNVAPEQKGIIWEVCCHLAYLQLHFLPDITEVYAVGGKIKYPVYDDFAVLLRTRSQRFGLIELSWVSTETDIIYELRDSNGQRLQIYRDFDYFLEKSATPVFNVGGVIRNYCEDQKRILQKWARFGTSYFKKRKLLPTFNLISTYIETIIKDQPPPVPPEQGKNTIRLLECIERSLDEKKPVLLNA